MTTVLQYLVIAAVIGLVVFGLAVFVFGRGEQLAPLSPRTSPTELPEHDLSAVDVRKVKFAMALRGYRMSDVDWALDKMADQIDHLRDEVARLSGEPGVDVLPAGPGDAVLAGVPAASSAGQQDREHPNSPTTESSSQRDES